jgi:methionyl-tRNA formyltransferase
MTVPLRIIFCGTPQFAVPSLNHLLKQNDFKILAVYTQPDRPRGRGQEISFGPVKEVALGSGLEVKQPAKIRAPEVEEELKAMGPDVIVIIAYGQIIPARLLTIPRLGWINLHASLLPKYRGAAPIHWAIANGQKKTGNTTMRIDAGMDTGEMLLQQELEIGAEETTPELAKRLSEAGAGLMAETLRGIASGRIAGLKQDETAATMAPILKREDGWIDWSRTAEEIYNRMRGFAPWPGAYSEFRGQACHLQGRPVSGGEEVESLTEGGIKAVSKDEVVENRTEGGVKPPLRDGGAIVRRGERVLVACGESSLLELETVKLEGRKQVSAAEFANGARLQVGERFGKR